MSIDVNLNKFKVFNLLNKCPEKVYINTNIKVDDLFLQVTMLLNMRAYLMMSLLLKLWPSSDPYLETRQYLK